jgi:hypothetical protein
MVINFIAREISRDARKLAQIPMLIKKLFSSPEGYSSTGQVLGLLPRDHQFESHKPQGHWRFTWSLTLRPVRLVEMRAN